MSLNDIRRKSVPVLTLFLFVFLPHVSLWALPEEAKVISGDATIEKKDAATLNITASNQSIIEYSSFNIAENETVNFTLPDTNSFSLNRVTGGAPTEIHGTLTANGNLILINAQGILFGASSMVNVGGLIASTRDIQNENFLAGQYLFGSTDKTIQDSYTRVVNQGSIETRKGGFAILVGGAIANEGTIAAPLGTVSLASGDVVTVGISPKGLISIGIDKPVAKQVFDSEGKAVSEQIKQSGEITADGGVITLDAKAADGLFQYAVNQEGILRADTLEEHNGIIQIVAVGAVKSSGVLKAAQGEFHIASEGMIEMGGTYEAPQGKIKAEAGTELKITHELKAKGETTLQARRDIEVKANTGVDSGSLSFKADSDLDGIGAFLQAAGTTLSTTTLGDILISSSGESTLAHITSAGNLWLEQAGAIVRYTQHADSSLVIQGSLKIGTGVTLAAANATYKVAKDWINLGSFLAQTSLVRLIGALESQVKGSNTFNNLTIIEPGKTVLFDSDAAQQVTGTLTFQGGFGKLLILRSSDPNIPWKINPTGLRDISYVDLINSTNVNIHGPPIQALNSKNSLQNTHWDFAPILFTGTTSSLWSDPSNWSGGFIPGIGDAVILRRASAEDDSIVDSAFPGTILSLILDSSFSGTLLLSQNLTVSKDVTLAGGRLDLGSHNLTIGGDWTHSGGILNARIQILTPTGWKKISEIEAGDQVIAYDEDGNKITNTIQRKDVRNRDNVEAPFIVYLINGQYQLFQNQSVWANNRVVHASEINIGDTIYNDNHQGMTVASIEELTGETQWTSFTVSGNHSYIVNGLLLHNASRYWVGSGASANWNATGNTNWSATSSGSNNASVPGSSDDVFFDGVGGGASNSTLSAAITILSLDMTGYVNTLTHNSSVTLTIAGDLYKLASGMTYTLGSATTSATTFTSTTGTSGSPTAITTNGKTIGNFSFNGSGGYFTLQDALTSSGQMVTSNGTFDANNKNVTARDVDGSTGTRTITMGTGTWTLTRNNGTIWDTSVTLNLTLNLGNPIVLNYTGATGTRTINAGALAEGSAPSFNITGGTDTVATTASGSFGSLDFTGFAGTLTNTARTLYGSLTIVSGMTITAGSNATTFAATSGTKTITSNGVTLDFPITFNGVGGTFQLADNLTVGSTRTVTLTNGTFDANNKNFTAGLFSSSNSNTRTITMGTGTWTLTGNNGTIWTTSTTTGLTFTRGNAIVSNYSGSTGTRTISTGSLGESSAPSFNITAGTDTVTMTTEYLDIDFTGFAGTLSNSIRTLYGNLTVASGMTVTDGGSTTTFAATSGTKTITTNGVTFIPITFNGVGGTWQLGDALTVGSTRLVTLTNGTLNANNFNFSMGLFASNNSNTRTLTMGTGTWSVTGNSGTVWNTSGTSMTINKGSTPIQFTYAGSTGNRTIQHLSGSETVNIDISITAGTDTINNLGTNSSYRNVDFTGFAGTYSTTSSYAVYGNFTLSSGMTWTGSGGTITFAATSGTKTITSNGKTMDANVTFNGVGGTWQLADAMTVGSSRTTTLTNGAFDANNKNFSTGLFSSSNSNTRTITMGTGTWTLASTGTVWTTATTTGLTFSGSSATIKTTDSSATAKTISAGSLANFSSIWISAGTSTDVFTNVTNVVNLDFTGFSGTGPTFPATINGSLTLASGMTMPAASATAITFAATSGTKTITSAGQTIDRPIIFNGVGGTWQLADAMAIGSTRAFDITNGTLDLASFNLTAAGAFTIGASGTLKLQGGETVSTIDTVTAGSTVIYNGTSSYTTSLAAGNTYSNLTFNGSGGVWEPNGAVTVGSNLTITTGTFDIDGQNLTVTSTFSNDGTLRLTGGETTFSVTMDTDSGTVEYDGTTSYTGLKAGNTYYNLIFNGTGGTWTLNAALTANNNLTITAGTLDASTTNYGVTVGATWSRSGTFTARSGTLTLTGTSTFSDTMSFYNITINGSGKTVTLGGALTASNNLTITAGTLDVSASGCSSASCSISVGGNWSNSGTFTARSGTVTLTSTSASATITSGSSSFYNLTQNGTGGTYTLQDALTATNNLTITAGTLDTKSGSNFGITIGNNYSNSGTFTARSGTVTFNATATGKTITAGGSSFYDLTFNGVGGGWTLQDAATVSDVLTITNGTLSAGSVTLTLSGTTGTPFSNSGTFTASTSTVSYTGNNASGNTTVANVTYYNLTLNNASETYVLAANATANNNLTLTAGTLDTVSGQNYSLSVGGNWSNSGTFTARSGTVTFDGASGTQTLNSGGTSFNNISHSGAGTLQLATNALTTSGTFTNSAGTFDANALAHTVTGLATVSGGTYTASTATQTFDGGLTISGGTFTGSTGTVDVNGAMTLSSGTLTAPSGTMTVSGNFTHSGGTFTHNSGSVTLDGTNQVLSGATTFNNLTKTVTSAATLTFPSSAGNEQTVVGTLRLEGAASNLLSLRSSTDGTQSRIDPQGTRTISYLDVKDSNNINSTAVTTAGFNITNSGNNTGWTFAAAAAASTTPTLSLEKINESVVGIESLLDQYNQLFVPSVIVVPAATPFGPVMLVSTIPAPAVAPAIPKPSANLFQGITATSLLPPALSPDFFNGVTAEAFLSPFIRAESFKEVSTTAFLPEAIHPENFTGAEVQAFVPESLEKNPFEGVMGGAELKVEFPGGGTVFVSYETGVPLGTEKPILEPKASRTKRREE